MRTKAPCSQVVGDSSESLPCLYSPISTEIPQNHVETNVQNDVKDTIENAPVFTTGRKKTAFILAESVEKLAKIHGIERVGFLTLTFSDHVLCPKEAQRRLNSLLSHVIKPRYTDYVGVFERQKSGRIHYHFLVTVQQDIKTGVDFDALARCDYKTAGNYLRSEWAFWRTTARKYRFGRTELLPVKSSIEAIKFYVGKYISKTVNASVGDQDKGVRLVRYSRGARAGTKNFAFISNGNTKWREAVAFFAELIADQCGKEINDMNDLSAFLGSRWAYKCRPYILAISEILEAYEPFKEKIGEEFNEKLKKDFDVTMFIKAVRS